MTEKRNYSEPNTTRENYGHATIAAMSGLQQPFVDPDSKEERDIRLPTGIYAREPVVKKNSPDFELVRRFLGVNQQIGSPEKGQAQIEEVLEILEFPLSKERTDRRTRLSDGQKQRYVATSQFIAERRAQREKRER